MQHHYIHIHVYTHNTIVHAQPDSIRVAQKCSGQSLVESLVPPSNFYTIQQLTTGTHAFYYKLNQQPPLRYNDLAHQEEDSLSQSAWPYSHSMLHISSCNVLVFNFPQRTVNAHISSLARLHHLPSLHVPTTTIHCIICIHMQNNKSHMHIHTCTTTAKYYTC